MLSIFGDIKRKVAGVIRPGCKLQKNTHQDKVICSENRAQKRTSAWIKLSYFSEKFNKHDYWTIANAAIDVRAFIPEGDMNMVASERRPFLSIGRGTELPGFCMRAFDNESPNDAWTEIELVCFQGKSLHIVNGKVVMVLQNSRYNQNGKDFPLTKGKIQIQSEAAEVFYKDIAIKQLDKLPAKFAAYFE